MSAERFMKLVEENDGFEFVQAFREDEDHLLGGKGDTFWFTILRDGKVKESYIGTLKDGVWQDVYLKGRGKKRSSKEMPAGTTIGRIAEAAFLCQEEKWVKDRKGRLVADGHPHLHYVKGFGDKAVDISEKYGVTIGYSDLQDVPAGFHLRYLYTGADVEMPE